MKGEALHGIRGVYGGTLSLKHLGQNHLGGGGGGHGNHLAAAPFSILFVKNKHTTFSTNEVMQSLYGVCVHVGYVKGIILPKVTI